MSDASVAGWKRSKQVRSLAGSSLPLSGGAGPAGIVRLILLAVIAAGWGVNAGAAEAAAADRTVLITGSNRGIGLEFVRQYAAAGWNVIATCRSPDKAGELQTLSDSNPSVRVEKLDVTRQADIDVLSKKYAGKPLHLLINNAALLGPRDAQSFTQQDYQLALDQYDVNALGPLRVSRAFADNLSAAGSGKIVTLGSAAGSNGYLKPAADFYSYRASKAAVHLLMHNLSLELADSGIVVSLINPGLVDTRGLADIGPDDPVPEDFRQIVRLIRSGALELISPQESVAAMLPLIDGLTMKQSGLFLNYDGQTMPW